MQAYPNQSPDPSPSCGRHVAMTRDTLGPLEYFRALIHAGTTNLSQVEIRPKVISGKPSATALNGEASLTNPGFKARLFFVRAKSLIPGVM